MAYQDQNKGLIVDPSTLTPAGGVTDKRIQPPVNAGKNPGAVAEKPVQPTPAAETQATAPVADKPVQPTPAAQTQGTGQGQTQNQGQTRPVQQGGAGSTEKGYSTATATTPDGRTITVEYRDGKRITDIPDGTIVHTAGGDFRYNSGVTPPAAGQQGGGSATGAPQVGGLGSTEPGYSTATATTPDGRTIIVEYQDGRRITQIPPGTVVHTAGGDFVYNGEANGLVGVQGGQGVGGIGPLTNEPTDIRELLKAQTDLATERSNRQIDFATERGILELQRAEQDAQQQFQTQRNQVSADEQKALDNQALYAERRGDKGGIGMAQYAQIQATAAQNRLAVNQAQTKLSTDTARQIADLRAQGEFQKADAILELTQSYLAQLQQWFQYADQFYLDRDQFNKQLEQWNLNYEMQLSEITGNFRGGMTMEMRQMLMQSGQAMMEAGIMPSEAQLAAMSEMGGMTTAQIRDLVGYAQALKQMGMEEDQIALELKRLQFANAKSPTVKSTGSRSSSSSSTYNPSYNSGDNNDKWSSIYDEIEKYGYDPKDYFAEGQRYKSLGYKSASEAVSAYNNYLARRDYDEEHGSSSGAPAPNRNPLNIPQAYLDDLESLSNGGASAETMGQTLYKWFMAKKLSRDQLNWLLNSYGSGDFAVRMGDVIRDLLAENGG